jgi:thioredoxin reductase (NADPH)
VRAGRVRCLPFIFPDKKIHLQYTTTSPKLHKVLGVESPVFDD